MPYVHSGKSTASVNSAQPRSGTVGAPAARKAPKRAKAARQPLPGLASAEVKEAHMQKRMVQLPESAAEDLAFH